jgi:FlaA1/EpsC-like NDP-sugar epimerase
MGSRGSVIPFFHSLRENGILPITDERMTRFMITLEQGVNLVWKAFDDMEGGEIYVKKIPSIKLTDLAIAVAPDCKIELVGIRPGEKLHEQMISTEDSNYTYEYDDYYKILPTINNWAICERRIKDGKKVPDGFSYTSENNQVWMTPSEVREWIAANLAKIGMV